MAGSEARAGVASGNVLLEALLDQESASAGAGLGQALKFVDVEMDEVVHEAGAPVEHVYFPVTAVFGLLTAGRGTPPVEVMPVGSEGLVGLTAVLGDGTSPHSALCQVPGQAVRVPAEALRLHLDAHGPARRLLGVYNQLTIALISQRVACSQRHTAEQRCADWLLRHCDQVNGNAIPLTQQFLAAMLGLRRTTVTAVAARLQSSRLISYRYGRVLVEDHAGLEQLACSCYRLFRSHLDTVHAAASSGTGTGPRPSPGRVDGSE